MELTSTNEPFGLASPDHCLKRSWVGFEVPSDNTPIVFMAFTV
jgi:hypothetical protein